MDDAQVSGAASKRGAPDAFVANVLPIVRETQAAGLTSSREIAAALMRGMLQQRAKIGDQALRAALNKPTGDPMFLKSSNAGNAFIMPDLPRGNALLAVAHQNGANRQPIARNMSVADCSVCLEDGTSRWSDPHARCVLPQRYPSSVRR